MRRKNRPAKIGHSGKPAFAWRTYPGKHHVKFIRIPDFWISKLDFMAAGIFSFSLQRRRGTEQFSVLPLSLRVSVVVFSLLLASCGNPNTPLDADTRHLIDSTSASQIRIVRKEQDSLCESQRQTVLPKLVDSIKQKRMREIQEQLKTVPR